MLTGDRNTPRKEGLLIVVPVAAGATIYAGSLVAANATGYATPGATATTLTYLGRAEVMVDNTDGGDGDEVVTVRRGESFQFGNSPGDPVSQASLGQLCYIEDDEAVSATDGSSTQSAAGIVLGVDSDGVWVL